MIRKLKLDPSGCSDAKGHSFVVVLNQFSAVAIVVS